MLNSTAPQDAPLTLLLILGQDIKSDGFSIETCKIMVDMLDVSFNRPRGQRLGECETALWEDSNTCFLPLTAASGPRRPRCRTVVSSDLSRWGNSGSFK